MPLLLLFIFTALPSSYQGHPAGLRLYLPGINPKGIKREGSKEKQTQFENLLMLFLSAWSLHNILFHCPCMHLYTFVCSHMIRTGRTGLLFSIPKWLYIKGVLCKLCLICMPVLKFIPMGV